MADTPENTPEEARNRRLEPKDFDRMAEEAVEEKNRRKKDRADLEKQWDEIDRQVRMEPLPRVDTEGRPLDNTKWMPNLELPLQSQTLEVLTADARRLMFPDDRGWFRAHAATTDEYLGRVDFQSLVAGDDNEVPSAIKQFDADMLVEGALTHFHSLYDFRGHVDLLNAEAFKYGTCVARARRVRLDKFVNEFRGVIAEKKLIPVLAPRSIRDVYLDDTPHAVMQEGILVAPNVIEVKKQKLDDLKMAAKKGNADPTAENGGWMPKALNGLEALEKGKNEIEILEQEGDVLVPRSQGPAMFLPNVIITVAVGKGGPKVIRYREREFPFRSYIAGTYHRTNAKSPYGASPLMMGSPIHKAATECFNNLQIAAMLNALPPVAWDPLDQYLEAEGGPKIAPMEQWPAQSEVKPQMIGDIVALQALYIAIIRHYEDVTGVSAPRLGGQTKSHQTAFAVDTEMTRGVVRTVDYVRTMNFGFMPTWLAMEFEMAKKSLKDDLVYLPRAEAYVQVSGKHLPDDATFEVFGAAGPLERREREQKRMDALRAVLAIEPLVLQAGGNPIDLDAIRKIILREGGYTDVDQFFAAGSAAGPVGAPPVAASPSGAAGLPGQPEGGPLAVVAAR